MWHRVTLKNMDYVLSYGTNNIMIPVEKPFEVNSLIASENTAKL